MQTLSFCRGHGYRRHRLCIHRNTIDLLGLNNTVMAHASGVKTGLRDHASFTKAGFWKLRPDLLGAAHGGEAVKDTALFVLYENAPDFRFSLMYSLLKGMFDDPDFIQAYTPALVMHKNKDFAVFGYYDNTFLSSLDRSVYFIKRLERKPSLRLPAEKN